MDVLASASPLKSCSSCDWKYMIKLSFSLSRELVHADLGQVSSLTWRWCFSQPHLTCKILSCVDRTRNGAFQHPIRRNLHGTQKIGESPFFGRNTRKCFMLAHLLQVPGFIWINMLYCNCNIYMGRSSSLGGGGGSGQAKRPLIQLVGGNAGEAALAADR